MTRPRINDNYEDENPYRMRRQPQDVPASGMSAVKIVAIVAGVVLTIAMMCAGLAFYAIHAMFKTGEGFVQQIDKMQKDQAKQIEEQVNSDKEKSRQFANGFVQELRGKRGDAAYAMTTLAYQKRVTLQQLKELMEKQAAALEQFGGFLSDVVAPDKGTTFSFSDSLRDRGKRRKLSVTAVKEGEKWKVDQFAVDDDDKQPKEP